MNEAETRAELIDPALKAAGWGVVDASRVRREVITLGRLQGAGKRAAQDIADYVLTYRNHKLAVIEAKRRDLPDTEGVGQAKKYAAKLQTRFAYSTNGAGIYQIDMETGAEQYVSAISRARTISGTSSSPRKTSWRDRFAAIPFEDKGGTGRRATTRTSPSRTRSKPSPRPEPHPADPRHRHRQDLHRLPARLEAIPEPVEPPLERRADPAAAHPVPGRPQHPRRPGLQRLFRLSRRRPGAH